MEIYWICDHNNWVVAIHICIATSFLKSFWKDLAWAFNYIHLIQIFPSYMYWKDTSESPTNFKSSQKELTDPPISETWGYPFVRQEKHLFSAVKGYWYYLWNIFNVNIILLEMNINLIEGIRKSLKKS